MSWVFFAIMAAILTATSTIVEKKTLFKQHATVFSATLSLLIFILSIPLLVVADFSNVDFVSVLIMFFISALASIAFLLAAKSLRHLDISVSAPLMTAGPAFTLLFAYIFLGESIKFYQLGGIFLLIVGAYALETKKDHSLLDPLKEFISSRYIHFIIFALILYGLTSVGDRFIVHIRGIPVITYFVIIHFFLAVNFLIMMFVFYDGFQGMRLSLKESGWWILLVAGLTFGYRFFQMEAVSMAYVALVSAIKRSSALFSTFIGGELFKEQNLFRKSVACLIIIAGVLIIVL